MMMNRQLIDLIDSLLRFDTGPGRSEAPNKRRLSSRRSPLQTDTVMNEQLMATEDVLVFVYSVRVTLCTMRFDGTAAVD